MRVGTTVTKMKENSTRNHILKNLEIKPLYGEIISLICFVLKCQSLRTA